MLTLNHPKKIIVIPDVHGRIFWREPVKKYLDAVDRVVFLGDYLDPYKDEDGLAKDIFENMMEIIELKRTNREKVVLLKGQGDDPCVFRFRGRAVKEQQPEFQVPSPLF